LKSVWTRARVAWNYNLIVADPRCATTATIQQERIDFLSISLGTDINIGVLMNQRIANHHLEKQVVFKGFLKEPQKAMQCLDIYILPSRNETFGLVLAEAMRCGVVVMGVIAGGVPEIIDHEQTGLLFDGENPTQLAKQIEFLIKNPEERKKLALRGKEKADRDFEDSIHFDKLGKILSNLPIE
jgi:glycosyltransferase involved in cell wall biosynthesis